MKKAIYAGSFDPFHKGHLGVVKKALKLFDHLYIVVTKNPEKSNQEPIKERVLEVQEFLSGYENVTIMSNSNKYTPILAKELGVNFLVRSGRNNMDFSYELELAAAAKSLWHGIETVLVLPDISDVNYQSRLLKQKID